MYSEEELLDKISEWHAMPESARTLAEHLGWSRQEYALWVKTNVQPPHCPEYNNGGQCELARKHSGKHKLEYIDPQLWPTGLVKKVEW